MAKLYADMLKIFREFASFGKTKIEFSILLEEMPCSEGTTRAIVDSLRANGYVTIENGIVCLSDKFFKTLNLIRPEEKKLEISEAEALKIKASAEREVNSLFENYKSTLPADEMKKVEDEAMMKSTEWQDTDSNWYKRRMLKQFEAEQEKRWGERE